MNIHFYRVLFLFLILGICAMMSAEERVVLRLEEPSPALVARYTDGSFDVAAYVPDRYLDLVLTRSEAENIISSGIRAYVHITEAQLRENMIAGRDLDGYRTYEDTYNELVQIATDYPDICMLYDLGNSQGKEYTDGGNNNYDYFYHDIWGLKLSDNVEEEEDEPCVYYMATHHAREPISLEVVMNILNHILENYGSDPQITDNVNNTQIWFVPLVNPDGHKIVTDETDVWWRKNIRDNDGDGQLDYSDWNGYPDGVDPNRNYGWEWGGTGASNDPLEQTYHGPEAWSEPEIMAMKELLDSHHFVAGISYHSHGELVLFPYGYSNNIYAPDHEAMEDLAQTMAYTIPGVYGGYYTPQEAWQLYPCSGTTDDFSYGEHGIFAYTIELAQEFIPPVGQIESICNNNLEAALILLDRVNQSTLTGIITDSATGLPLVAEIFINGIDNSGEYRKPYASDELFGRYYRLLQDGSYDVTFSAYGYNSVTFENVQITSAGQTGLDVVLELAPFTTLSGTVTDIDTMQPISGASLTLLDVPITPVFTDNNGNYLFPQIPEGIYQILVSAEDYVSIIEEINVTAENNIFDFQLQYSTAISFENGEFDDFWFFSGDAEWTIDNSTAYDGVYSARSGDIGSWDTSSLVVELDVTATSDLIFYKKVSCEDDNNDNFDYLAFFIDGAEQDRWDGEVSWSPESYTITPGVHIFEWRYVKDGYVSEGEDCGWIDYITFPETYIETFYALPESISVEMGSETTLDFNVLLVNDGPQDISYDLSLDPPVDWLELPDPANGVVPAEGDLLISLLFYTVGLEAGEYDCDLLIDFEDRERSQIVIPVYLTVTGTGNESNTTPLVTALLGNHPNPFNPDTRISFSLSSNNRVELHIYNIKGQLVKTLLDSWLNADYHDVPWNGTDNNGNPVPSGIYFYRLQTEDYNATRKMILMK